MSTGDSIEAQRLADQRQRDLDRAHARELDLAREQGRKEAEDEIFKEATNRHFATINGSIENTVKQLVAIGERLCNIESTMSTHKAVKSAIDQAFSNSGNKRFSRIQATAVIILASAAVGAFILSIISTVHG